MRTVLVAAETAAKAEVNLELITAARSLAGDDGKVIAAFTCAPGISPAQLPADTVCLLEHDALGESDNATFDATTDALTALATEQKPDLILFARTDRSSVVAPRLAFRIDAVFARDCTGAENTPEGLIVTRPVYGGNANARFRIPTGSTSIVTLRPGTFEPTTAGASANVKIFDVSGHIRDPRSTLLRTVQEQQAGVRLEDAEVVVSGGRGLGGPEPFKQLAELAELLGGALGASRAACDAGWIDHSHQVGLTGKTVSPKLYLGWGISGASQHMAGCSSARNIVAVNTDPAASIFSDARFGVAGDWSKVLPAFISAIRDIS
jgi:electron transfer flavoprotein alpha subunit